MSFSYGEGNKVYGRDINEARYNALMETFYNYYPELQKKVKVGKNYFGEDPGTAQFLERRVLGEDNVYIPDEDEYIVRELMNAYKTTKIELQACMNQTSEGSCKALKFRGMGRCVYEKKWFSFIRGGTCSIDQGVVEHFMGNLSPVIAINWDTLRAKPIRNSDPNLPNPDELTKTDMVNIIHDLGHLLQSFFPGKDLVTILEQKLDKNLLDLTDQQLLYYVYLFSYVIYVSQFLDLSDYKQIFALESFRELYQLINAEPSKNNLINFIVGFKSKLPPKKRRSAGWKYSVLIGPILILLMSALIPTAEGFVACTGYDRTNTIGWNREPIGIDRSKEMSFTGFLDRTGDLALTMIEKFFYPLFYQPGTPFPESMSFRPAAIQKLISDTYSTCEFSPPVRM